MAIEIISKLEFFKIGLRPFKNFLKKTNQLEIQLYEMKWQTDLLLENPNKKENETERKLS